MNNETYVYICTDFPAFEPTGVGAVVRAESATAAKRLLAWELRTIGHPGGILELIGKIGEMKKFTGRRATVLCNGDY